MKGMGDSWLASCDLGEGLVAGLNNMVMNFQSSKLQVVYVDGQ
jgi:hypothetical protein